MKLPQAYFLAILLLALLAYAQCASPPSRLLQLISTNRTETLFKRCPVLRKPFIASQYNDSLSWGRLQTAASLNWDGDALIYDILSNDTAGVQAQVKQNLTSTIIYFIFILIGLAIMIVFSPIMICCCCLPKKCPPCSHKDYSYTPCEKTWPAVILILVSIIAIGSMIGILIVNGEFKQGYSQTRCSLAIFFDDLLNGNYTQNGSQYFIGLKPLKVNLSSQFTPPTLSAPTSLESIVDQIESIKADVKKIPNNNEALLSLNYVSPIDTDPQIITSSFPTTESKFVPILGQASSGESLIGQIYAALESLRETIKEWLSPKKLGLPGSPLQKYTQLIDTVQNLDVDIDAKLSDAQTKFVDPILITIYVMAGLVVLLCVMQIFVTVLICSCKYLSCRRVLYFSCVLLTLLGILCFALAVLLSVTTAGVHYGCHYIEGALQTKAQFQYKFGPVFNNDLLVKMVAQCATTESNGVIVSSEQPRQLTTTLTPQQIRAILANYNSKLSQTIKSYSQSEIVDLSSLSDIKILQKLSDFTKYTCSATGFSTDSWVPSTSQQDVYVSCKLPQANKVTTQTCTIAEFENQSSNCKGCIDTSSILSQAKTFQDVLSMLNKRYPAQDCSAFNQELSSVWNNFYKKKADAISPVEQKANLVSKKIDDLISQTESIAGPSLQSSPRLLQLPVTQLTCKVLNQDLILLTNTFCTHMFNFSFRMRILTITGSFCLLLIMFCSTCLGMRTYKDKSKQFSSGEKPRDDDIGSEGIFKS